MLAYQQARPAATTGVAAPVPTFVLGVQTPTPTPTPTPTVAPVDRSTERFLSIDGSTWWRSTAGACSGAEPLVERSADAGTTWVDVTARYLGLAQVAGVDALAEGEAGVVAGIGAACEGQYLRTFTQGEFWESYPGLLAASRFIDAADPATVHLPAGEVGAPCAEAHGLRAAGDIVALVCEAVAYLWSGGSWVALPTPAVAAVAVDRGDVLVAARPEEPEASEEPEEPDATCAGLAVTRFPAGTPGAGIPAGCAEIPDAAAPAALAMSPDGLVVWSGDAMVPVR